MLKSAKCQFVFALIPYYGMIGDIMPDKRIHRGRHPSDVKLFAPDQLARLGAAVEDYSLLLSRGYATKSSLKLVGDKLSLTERQRLAVMRSACSQDQRQIRRNSELDITDIRDADIVIDGYNVLITIEAFLSRAILLLCRDGCIRDLASVHGSYRKVTETIPALQLIAKNLDKLGVRHALWLFDTPVSNSGKLKTMIYELIEENHWPWDVELTMNPDKELIATDRIVITSDSAVLDSCANWTNLTKHIITTTDQPETTSLIDMSG